MGRKSRAATAEKFAKVAAKADAAFEKDMQEAGQKKAKADRAAAQEKASKKTAEKNSKADEKETKASEASDEEIKECAIDGSECQTKDGKCHKTTPKGPFMGDDLVSCSKTKPAEGEDAGLGWAGIEPPLPAESCPKPDAACKAAAKACDADGSCKKAKAKGGTKGIVDVGCHGGKKGLNAFFAWSSACCDPKNIGFSDNIPMFKMQITAMPVYKNSGTNGRFKANRGAGSVCTMVKSLAAGMASGDDGGVFLQKSSMKEVKAKHAAANKADDASHKAADAKTNSLHKGLVGKVVSNKSTKAAAANAGANSAAAKAAAKAEAHWAKKEAHFRHLASALNKKQRHAAKHMEKGVKSARKALLADTAASLVKMHRAAVAEKAAMKASAAFQAKMKAVQAAMAKEGAAAKAVSAKRLATYRREMVANAKAKAKAIADGMKI